MLIRNLTPQKASHAVVIFDEVDEMIDEHAIVIPEDDALTVSGFVCGLFAKKSYSLTATIEQYHEEFLKEVMTMDPATIIQHESQRTLLD